MADHQLSEPASSQTDQAFFALRPPSHFFAQILSHIYLGTVSNYLYLVPCKMCATNLQDFPHTKTNTDKERFEIPAQRIVCKYKYKYSADFRQRLCGAEG